MPRVQENAPGIRPSRSISRGSRISDDHNVVALRGLDGIDSTDRLDLCIGFVDQGLDAAMDGLGH